MNPSSVLPIIPAPRCPLGHGPMPLLKTELTPMFAPRETEKYKCPLCSVEIFRPVPDHEL